MDGNRHSRGHRTLLVSSCRRLWIIVLPAGLLVAVAFVHAKEFRAPGKTSTAPVVRPPTVAGQSAKVNPERLRYANESVQPQLKYAFSLADRGAVYSANARFVDCLRAIARILDHEQGKSSHEPALFLGLTALREADEFAQAGPLTTRVNVSRLVVVHKTPVLKGIDASHVTPSEALRRYYLYAQQQLVAAAGKVPAASQALYGMGRIEAFRSAQNGLTTSAGSSKALLLHQAAVAVDANNYAAANEFGVLLARAGRLDASRRILEHSISARPQPETWHNLSEVYAKLGDGRKADAARLNSAALSQARHEGSHDLTRTADVQHAVIRWVDAEELANRGVDADCNDSLRTGATSATTANSPQQSAGQAANSKKGGTSIGRAWTALRDRFSAGSQDSNQSKPDATTVRESRDRTNRQ